MNLTQVNRVHNFFLHAHFEFRESEAKEIWGESYKHYWDKYQGCSRNILYFWNRLDETNKIKLWDWYIKKTK